ncbi:hypothetical protein [uncultured Gammaproteobacteria bacterium]|nr:hypothetical protein [uncultured Gammaproteobacteria bacterium]
MPQEARGDKIYFFNKNDYQQYYHKLLIRIINAPLSLTAKNVFLT